MARLGDAVSGFFRDLDGSPVPFRGVITNNVGGVVITFLAPIWLPGFGRSETGIWYGGDEPEWLAAKVSAVKRVAEPTVPEPACGFPTTPCVCQYLCSARAAAKTL